MLKFVQILIQLHAFVSHIFKLLKMNSKLLFSSVVILSLLGYGNSYSLNSGFFLTQLADLLVVPASFPNPATVHGTDTFAGLPTLDKMTFVLVDSTLFLMQLGKTGLGFNGFDDPTGPLFDFTWNTTRVLCRDQTCATNNIFMELNEAYIYGMSSIKLYNDFQPKKMNVTLSVGTLAASIDQYRHTITDDISNITRIGEGALFALENATYGFSANYDYVPNVGIQISNLDIRLDIGSEKWTIMRRYLILEDGTIVEEGLYQGDLGADVMSTWNGDYEGQPLKPQYQRWAEFLINCGLSGGRSSEACSEVEGHLKKYKLDKFPRFG